MTVRFGKRRRRFLATRARTRCGIGCIECGRRRAGVALRDRAATVHVPSTSIASVANSKKLWTMNIRSLSTWAFAALVSGDRRWAAPVRCRRAARPRSDRGTRLVRGAAARGGASRLLRRARAPCGRLAERGAQRRHRTTRTHRDRRDCCNRRNRCNRHDCPDCPDCRTAATAATAAAAPPPSESPPDARAPSEAEFGLAPPATGREPAPSATELVSRVAALREIQPGRFEITLVNGQVWRQTNSDRYPLEIGHEVRIYSTRFGSYFRLSATELRSFVQVERIR